MYWTGSDTWLEPHATILILAVVLGIQALLNTFSVKLVGGLSNVSAWWRLLGVAVISTLLFWAPAGGFTGHDASAHGSEETIQARISAPRGIVNSIWVSLIAGFILLFAVSATISNQFPVTIGATEQLHALRRAGGRGRRRPPVRGLGTQVVHGSEGPRVPPRNWPRSSGISPRSTRADAPRSEPLYRAMIGEGRASWPALPLLVTRAKRRP